jgi:hypothetical protein
LQLEDMVVGAEFYGAFFGGRLSHGGSLELDEKPDDLWDMAIFQNRLLEFLDL